MRIGRVLQCCVYEYLRIFFRTVFLPRAETEIHGQSSRRDPPILCIGLVDY